MIHIYLRQAFHSPNCLLPNRKRPEWFNKRHIFNNIRQSLTDNCRLKIIYDCHFGDDSEADGLNIVKINQGTEAGSFLQTLEIVRNDNLKDDDIVYFLEDDYLHKEHWDIALIEGLEISDYVSLYDHLDKYLHYPGLKSEIYLTKITHWRTTPSTCNTYACKFATLKKDFEIHKMYSINHNGGISNDNGKFLHLGGIGRRLITPIPGYSTHCDLLQSPLINWEDYLIK